MRKQLPVLLVLLAFSWTSPLPAQPSFAAPMPAGDVVGDSSQRRLQYHQRIHEVLAWRAAQPPPAGSATMDLASIAAKLSLREDAAQCSRDVIRNMQEPGSGPFWMFPVVGVAFLGRDQLSAEAQAAIRDAWRTQMQVRGDTENHWVMYYASLYLMSELYPEQPGSTWYNGKSSTENLAESREFLLDWMKLTTTVGQGEFNCTHYIGEYMIPMTYMASWAKDPAMRLRARMMLDWLASDFAENTFHGMMRGANARTDDTGVIERWNALSSFFSWILFNNTAPTASYGGWGVYFAAAAENYDVPEVIYRIATDRAGDFVQRDLKRTRRRWRYSDELWVPVYKTNYVRRDYAVGSYQGGLADGIQTHVWDVTWAVPDPRGAHNTMFSLHPHSSETVIQMYFTPYPEPWIKGVTKEGKPSYDSPEKVLGCSPYEEVFQDLDTVVALYNIPEGTRFPHINGFFSKDLVNVTEDKSGWIFAQGGKTYLAYRPLAGYEWQTYRIFASSWNSDRVDQGDRIIQSPHLQNGTIVQAASADEFKSFDEFRAAINALPLEFSLAPLPTVKFTTLRGKKVAFTFGSAPMVDGAPVNYSGWKLFEGPYLNAEKNSGRLVLTHGRLKRVIDFNALSVTDSVAP